MNVRARLDLGVRLEGTRLFALFVWGEALFFSWVRLFFDFSMSDTRILTRLPYQEGSWGRVNRLGSVQGGIPEAY